MNILITGAGGFIGRALCSSLSSSNKVVGIDIAKKDDKSTNIAWEQADLTDSDSVATICEKHSPDVVIHCAGIAHQKIGAIGFDTYMRVNSEVTEKLAKAAGEYNPDVCFVFLSSVSIYGEGRRETGDRRTDTGISEEGECWPSSDYAVSKLDAERRLIALADGGIIRNLVILRLAPVYDREWSLNLDRRVFAPKKLAYLRFGSGLQRMSALARPNLVEFIGFLIHRSHRFSQVRIFNVCDAEVYTFNNIIRVFKKSGIHPNLPVISIPIFPVWIATRMAGAIFRHNKDWWHACYDKLASDQVFDNKKMLGTGFKPRHSLETIFQAETK